MRNGQLTADGHAYTDQSALAISTVDSGGVNSDTTWTDSSSGRGNLLLANSIFDSCTYGPTKARKPYDGAKLIY